MEPRYPRVPSVAVSLLLALALGACRSVSPPGAYFQTDPPGAELVIDGEHSGHVTPCLVRLDEERAYEVRLELAGFEPRVVTLAPSDRWDKIRWREGAMAPHGMRGPFGLDVESLFVPYRLDESHSPCRVFLRLEPTPDSR